MVMLCNGGSRNPQRHNPRASHLLRSAPIIASTVLWYHRITSQGFWWAWHTRRQLIDHCTMYKQKPHSWVHYIFSEVLCVSYPIHHAVKLNFSCTNIILALISPAMASAGLHFLWGEKAGGCMVVRCLQGFLLLTREWAHGSRGLLLFILRSRVFSRDCTVILFSSRYYLSAKSSSLHDVSNIN